MVDLFTVPDENLYMAQGDDQTQQEKGPVRMELDPARMTLLTGFFETYLRLNEVEERKLEEAMGKIDEKEARRMIEITTSWEERGRVKGRAEGKTEGKAEGKAEGELAARRAVVRKMLQRGMTLKEIAEITELSADEILRVKDESNLPSQGN